MRIERNHNGIHIEIVRSNESEKGKKNHKWCNWTMRYSENGSFALFYYILRITEVRWFQYQQEFVYVMHDISISLQKYFKCNELCSHALIHVCGNVDVAGGSWRRKFVFSFSTCFIISASICGRCRFSAQFSSQIWNHSYWPNHFANSIT